MIRDIVQLPEAILRAKAHKVHRQSKEYISRVVEDLLDTARYNDALGLAAPQIGVSLRIAVVKQSGQYFRLINPVITAAFGEEIGNEGCLSLPPQMRVNVERATRIKFRDAHGHGDVIGMTARVVQHELDHLDGVLIIDKEVVDANGRPKEAGTQSEVL